MPRLVRAVRNIARAAIQCLIAPSQAREFLAHAYLYDPLPFSNIVHSVTVRDVLTAASEIQITLRDCFPTHGNMTGNELITLCSFVKRLQPRAVFEFGTFNGLTTLQIALNAADECVVYTLNLPLDHSETLLPSSEQDRMVQPRRAGSGQAFRDAPERSRIVELFGDSATFDYAPYYGSCDFVLVDAGHEYENVKSDVKNSLKLLRAAGGVIFWHDFPNAPGVCRFIEELSVSRKIFHLKDTRFAFTVVGETLSHRLLKTV